MGYRTTKILSGKVPPEHLSIDTSIYGGNEFYFTFCELFRTIDGETNRDEHMFVHGWEFQHVYGRLYSVSTENLKHVAVLREDFPGLTSENRKYVFQLRPEFYHFFLDNLVYVFKIHEAYPDAEFYFGFTYNGDVPAENEGKKNLQFLEELLQRHKITYTIIDTPSSSVGVVEYPTYKAKNAILADDYFNTAQITLKDIARIFNTYINEIPEDPDLINKKVYLSRRSLIQFVNPLFEIKSEEVLPGWDGYKDNLRIYQEELIEDYLRSVGFEIVYPEQLPTVKDQVELLGKAKVFCGVTGSGLVNQLLMPDSGMVIELKVEDLVNLGSPWPSQVTYQMYNDFGYSKDHTYISLDVSDKEGSTAVKKLKKLFSKLNIN